MDSRKNRKLIRAVVVSDKMDKTVVVKVESLKKHPKYHKFVKISKKFKAHDEMNECREGYIVEMVETRPLSKGKNWRILKIIERPVGIGE